MTENKVPVAVIGVGHLGSRHARIYREMADAELVGVADIDLQKARAVAAEQGGVAVSDYRELASKIRAASVTVPTAAHHEVVLALLAAGIDVLVEKPIATTLAESREILERAEAGARVLAVGHTERYNPAVEAVLRTTQNPRFIEVHRLASFSPRSLDIDVVLDLMIHDLDVVATLVSSEVVSIEAIGVPVLTDRVDIANARLRFANDCVANLTASRISRDRVRKLRVWEPERYVSLDYLQQEAVCYRLVRDGSGGMPQIRREELPFGRDEPLKRELVDFVACVRTRRAPRVGGRDGLRALELANRILDALAQR